MRQVQSATSVAEPESKMTGPRGAGRGNVAERAGAKSSQSTLQLSCDPPVTNSILENLEAMCADIRDVEDAMQNMKSLRKEFDSHVTFYQAENELLKERIAKLEKKEERRERRAIEKNVVLRGMDQEMNREKFEEFCENTLGVAVEVVDVTPTKTRGKRGLTIIELASIEDREKILKCKSTKLKGSKISINRDQTQSERDIQRKIRDIAGEEARKGKKVHVRYRSLEVDGVKLVWEDAKGLVPQREHTSPVRRQEHSLN